jgi:Putative Actinobacterial Holin-X, holin superfamily III
MVRGGRPDGAEGQQSLGELVALAAKDVSQLLRYEISLAKSELKMDARRIGIAAALAVVGLFVACLLVVLLCFAFAYGLVAAGIWTWAAFLIVAGTCLLLIALAGLIAFGRIRKVTGMKMTRQTVIDDLGMLRRGDSSANGSGPAITNPATASGDRVGKGGKPEIPQAHA